MRSLLEVYESINDSDDAIMDKADFVKLSEKIYQSLCDVFGKENIIDDNIVAKTYCGELTSEFVEEFVGKNHNPTYVEKELEKKYQSLGKALRDRDLHATTDDMSRSKFSGVIDVNYIVLIGYKEKNVLLTMQASRASNYQFDSITFFCNDIDIAEYIKRKFKRK